MWTTSNPYRPNVNFTQKREVDKLVMGIHSMILNIITSKDIFSGIDLISAEVILLRGN